MPTGYTSDIYDGKKISFPEFAMGCARAFGALIMMRDEPADAEIPEEFKANTKYYSEKVREAKRELARVQNMTQEDASAEAKAEHDKQMKYYNNRLVEVKALRNRYKDMLRKVADWVPPTPEHEELKKFMAEQLKSSIEGDCYNPQKPKLYTGAAWKKELVDGAKKDIEYYGIELDKEVGRAKGRTDWVKALRGSLNKETVS
jgi:hypothetical protein